MAVPPKSRAELIAERDGRQHISIERPRLQNSGSPRTREELIAEREGRIYTPIDKQATISQEKRSILSGEGARIGNVGAIITICIFLIIDLLEGVTTAAGIGVVLSYITPVVANIAIWLCFKFKDVEVYFKDPKTLLVALGYNGLELVPGSDVIPIIGMGWTLWAITTIIFSRVEDRAGIQVPKIPTSAKEAATGKISKTS